DLEIIHGSDKAPLLLLEISGVAERQPIARLLQGGQSETRRRLALGMEMSGQRSRRRLSQRRAVVQHETAADCERCAYRRQCLHKFSSGCHWRLLSMMSVDRAACGPPSLPQTATPVHRRCLCNIDTSDSMLQFETVTMRGTHACS